MIGIAPIPMLTKRSVSSSYFTSQRWASGGLLKRLDGLKR